MVETIHNRSTAAELIPNRSTSGQVNGSKNNASRPSKAEAVFAKSDGKGLDNGQASADVKQIVKVLNKLVSQVLSTKVIFDVDENTGEPILLVLNKETGEVIRQVPAEAAINLSARMDQLTGLIFSEEA